jgi:hypothetical protein
MQTNKYPGFYRGIVVDTSDPLEAGRIRMKVPQLFGEQVTNWAWPIVTANSTGQIEPTPDSGVWAVFEGGDPNYPLWIGTF